MEHRIAPGSADPPLGRNLLLDVFAAAGVGITVALVGSTLPSAARKAGLDALGLAALGAAPFLANLLSAFAGRVGPRSQCQIALWRAAGAGILLVLLFTTTPPIIVLVGLGYWLSLSASAPFQLRLWGAIYPSRLRGRVVGTVGTARAAAAGITALAAGMLADRFGGPTVVAVGALAGVVGAAAYVGLRVPVKASAAPVFSARAAVQALNERPTLRKLVLAQGFYGGGLIAATPLFAIVYIDRLGASLAEVGVGGTLGFLAATLSSYGWGAVADRSGPVLPLRLGSVLGVFALVLAASAPSVLLLWVAAVGLGVAGSAIDIGINASIVDETSLETRASALAGWNAITGARGLVVPFVAGGLVQFGLLSVTSTLIGCAVASSIGALMFAAVGRAGFDWFPRSVSIRSLSEPRPTAQV